MDFVPPRKVFRIPPRDPRTLHEELGYDIPNFLYPTLTKTGGMASVFQGHPLPRKGFTYSEAVKTNNKIKRVSLALFQSFFGLKKGIKGFINLLLENYYRLVASFFNDCERPPIHWYKYYSEFSKSTWDFSFLFLRWLGVPFETAFKTGMVLATIFQYDDAYTVRVMDVLSETTKEKLLKNPRQEITRLLGILKKRDPSFSDSKHGAGWKIETIAKIIRITLLIPRVRKAFDFALENTNFQWFQYDEMDLYWSLNRIDYQVQGKSFEERKKIAIEKMAEYAKEMNPGKQIVINETDTGFNVSAI